MSPFGLARKRSTSVPSTENFFPDSTYVIYVPRYKEEEGGAATPARMAGRGESGGVPPLPIRESGARTALHGGGSVGVPPLPIRGSGARTALQDGESGVVPPPFPIPGPGRGDLDGAAPPVHIPVRHSRARSRGGRGPDGQYIIPAYNPKPQ